MVLTVKAKFHQKQFPSQQQLHESKPVQNLLIFPTPLHNNQTSITTQSPPISMIGRHHIWFPGCQSSQIPGTPAYILWNKLLFSLLTAPLQAGLICNNLNLVALK